MFFDFIWTHLSARSCRSEQVYVRSAAPRFVRARLEENEWFEETEGIMYGPGIAD